MTTAGSDAEQFTTTGWPWRTGNAFRLLDGGAEFFPAMLAAIDGARSLVLLEMYLVRSGGIVTQLHRGAHRGRAARRARLRAVRWVRRAAPGARGPAPAARRRRGAAVLQSAASARTGSRNLLRDHRKLLVCDGRVAFVGGAGLTDDFAPGGRRGPWREVMVQIEGPVVADWQRAFARTWRRCGGELALPAASAARILRQRGRTLVAFGGAAALGARQRRDAPHRCGRRAAPGS